MSLKRRTNQPAKHAMWTEDKADRKLPRIRSVNRPTDRRRRRRRLSRVTQSAIICV